MGMNDTGRLSRREFLSASAAGGVLAAASMGLSAASSSPSRGALPWRDRCRQCLARTAEASFHSRHGLSAQTAALAVGRPIDDKAFRDTLEFIATRADCVDFAMADLIRLLYLFGSGKRFSAENRRAAEEALAGFRYWLYPQDKPVATRACYWTENHQVLYSSCEYLAGQLLPGRTFAWLGRKGSWHREHGRRNLLCWLAIKARHGLNEWLSPGYYGEDLLALMNLADFAADAGLARAARGVAELLLLDVALHGFDAGLRATSGRSYFGMIRDARRSATGSVFSLVFEADPPTGPLSPAAVALATSPTFRVPPALVAIANDRPGETLIRQKSGMSPEQALSAGFDPARPEDIFTFWSMQAYTMPRVFLGNLAACERWNIERFTRESWKAKREEFRRAGDDPAKVSDRSATAMFGANIQTCRTPDYQVSTALDYRPGRPGYQQLIWIANLGGAATVWTTSPDRDSSRGRPNYWMGNAHLPRAAQHRNLVMAIYRIPADDPRPFSHVYFPEAEFDEVCHRAGWLFGRKGEGYVAVTSRPAPRKGDKAKYAGVERIANASDSAWVCKLGRKAVDGSFDEFVGRLVAAEVTFADGKLSFGQGDALSASLGWEGEFLVNGQAVPLDDYPRYDSPYVRAAAGEQVFRIRCGGHRHTIDLSALEVKPVGPRAPQPAGYTIPIVDLDGDARRQVVVDREAGRYLGHPTTVLLPDGKTMYAVYPKGHGRGAIVRKRSDDGGRTWSRRLPTPASWATSKEVPTIHRVVDAEGKARLILFSGLYPARMAVSEDDGRTWGELEPLGDWGGIVVMGDVIALKKPGRYLAMFHDDGRFFAGAGKVHSPRKMTLYKTFSDDGGLTWSLPEEVFHRSDVGLCEPGMVRSPDGRQIAALLRENYRVRNSHVVFSDDEGATWTDPVELPGALTGDRHQVLYVPDGRLIISFRDTTRRSPTRGDWVAWVGTYADIVAGRQGQYRVRLKDNTKGLDCAYPAMELLPDGTVVATTYGHWDKGEQPYILSVRFKMAELDALAAKAGAKGAE